MNDFVARLHELERRVALLEAATGGGLSDTDQTIKGSHDRLDNLFGAGSLGSRWYNRYALPASPNSHDAEMTGDPVGANGWAWAVHPSSIHASSGVNYSDYPHWQYVYIYGNGTGRASLRCTDAGNFPRYKSVLLNADPNPQGTGGWYFEFRSCVDANNYICWKADGTSGLTISAWYYVAGVGTQVGNTITLYPPVAIWLQLGNRAAADYLEWNFAVPWGAHVSRMPAVSTVTGQRAANIQYIELLYDQGNQASLARYFVDYVRFSSS